MTTLWRPCGGKFVIGNVLMWAEAAWVKQGWGRREKTVFGGGRRMTAQVDGVTARGTVGLTVIECEILFSAREPLKPLKRGEKIWRKRETLEKGGVHRRVGNAEEESAQAIVGSDFLGPEPTTLQGMPARRAPAAPRGRYRGGRGRGPRTRLRPR